MSKSRRRGRWNSEVSRWICIFYLKRTFLLGIDHIYSIPSNFSVYKQLEHKFKQLETDAADFGSGNKDALKNTLGDCKDKMQGLKPLFDKHMESLQESLKFHEMMSELNAELQWIKEKDKLILSGEVGTGLMQVRSQTKRHKSLEEEVSNHLPVVYELIERASDYGDESKKKTVDDACSTLAESAEQLQMKLAERASELGKIF